MSPFNVLSLFREQIVLSSHTAEKEMRHREMECPVESSGGEQVPNFIKAKGYEIGMLQGPHLHLHPQHILFPLAPRIDRKTCREGIQPQEPEIMDLGNAAWGGENSSLVLFWLCCTGKMTHALFCSVLTCEIGLLQCLQFRIVVKINT